MNNLSLYTLKSLGFSKIHLNRCKFTDLTENYKDLKLRNIPIVLDDGMLCDTLGITKKTLYFVSSPWCQAGLDKETKKPRGKPLYTVHKIPKGRNKKTGKPMFRFIQAPESRLKYVQKRVAIQILDKIPLPDYVTGFRKKKSPRDTAEVHANKKIVVSLDIKNFFGSIKQTHLMQLFITLFRYPKDVSKILSEVCTYKYFVPQGAPSSPSLSNIVGYYFFDKEVEAIAQKYSFIMTRFADDITLSTDKDYPKTETDIGEGKKSITSGIDEMISEISEVLNKSGFKVNRSKTKIMRSPARKWVLGQVVNVEPNILRRSYNILKCIVHNISVTTLGEQAKRKGMTEYQFLAWLRGKISHLQQVNRYKGEKLKDQLDLSLKAQGHREDIKEVKINK